MRVLGLALAGGLAVTTSVAAHAVPLGSNTERLRMVSAPALVQAWGGCGWGWHPVPGYWNQWRRDGFHRIARRTATTGAGTPMEAGKAH
jgi:succinate dehydrogenase/fumarate reductase flavoprotein subunit